MSNPFPRTAFRRAVAAGLLAASLGLSACDSAEDRLARHLENAGELLAGGEPAKATIEYRNALALDANNLEAHLGMASIYEAAKNYPAMLAHLNKVVEIDPKNAHALVQIGQMMLLGGRLDDAMNNANAALAVAPDDLGATVLKAGVSLRLGNVGQALEAARAVLARDPANPTAHAVLIGERMQAGDLSGALALADDITQRAPGDLGVALVKLQVLEQRGDAAATLVWLVELVSRFPEQIALRSALAQLHVRAGNLDAAEEQLRAIAAAQPEASEPALRVTQFLYGTKGPEAARAELAALIAARPQTAPFRIALAQLDHQSGRKDEAKAELAAAAASAVEAGRTDEANSIRLALARFAIEDDDREAARRLAGEILATDAANAGALGIRAALRYDEGDYNGALLDVRAALATQPNNPQLLILSARTHERNGNADLAGENLAAATQASGYEAATTLEYVAHLRRRGRADAVLTVLVEAAKRRPDDRAILTELAGAQIAAGDWVGADETANRLSAIDPAIADRIEAASLTGQERYDESLAVLGRLAGDPAQSGAALAAMVQVYARAGKLDEAVVFLDGLIAENAANDEALILRGRIRSSQGDVAGAETDFRAAATARPNLPGAWLALAQIAQSRGDAAAAIATAEEGIAAVENPAALLLFVGGLHERAMRFDEAIGAYRAALAAQPNSVVAANNFASLVGEHKAGDPAAIEEAMKIARGLQGMEVPAFQDTFGWLRHLAGDNEEALRHLIPAAEKLPDNPYVRYHIGVVYAALGDAESARPHLEAAAAADPAGFSRSAEAKAALAALPAAQQ